MPSTPLSRAMRTSSRREHAFQHELALPHPAHELDVLPGRARRATSRGRSTLPTDRDAREAHVLEVRHAVVHHACGRNVPKSQRGRIMQSHASRGVGLSGEL